MRKIVCLSLLLLTAAGCRMGPALEGPQVYPSEFGIPMARAGKLRESDIEQWQKTDARVTSPVTLAVLQVHRDTRYAGLSQEEWDDGIRRAQAARQVCILDGLGIGDEHLHENGLDRATAQEVAQKQPVIDAKTGSLFVAERWAASAAGANVIFIFATKVASDTYWNYWWTSYLLVVCMPFVPAQEQTVQAVTKGFLVDVTTGKILETAGAISTKNRRANPILRTEPLFQLEQAAVREAEMKTIDQIAAKLTGLKPKS